MLAKPNLLKISTAEVLAGLGSKKTVALESKFGNGDLIKLLDILGIGRLLTVKSPWLLEDDNGKEIINAGGYAALPFGEMYPPLLEFIHSYLEKNRNMGLPQQSASEWRAALETNLVSILAAEQPSHADSQVFFSNSGAEAIEAAIKFSKAARKKAKYIINFTKGYHGKTLGALSLTPNEEYQALFRPLMPGVKTLKYGDAYLFEKEIKRIGPKNIIAIVLEPIQGEGGVIIPPKDFLPTVNQVAKKHGIIIIADEIQSGLGRTGYWFASVAAGLEPDIITLAKPLGGGMVPIGATISRKNIVKKMLGGLESKRHSNTFGGGSLAMAVGLKSLEIIIEQDLVAKSKRNGKKGLLRLKEIQAKYPAYINEVRGAGMLFAIQLRHIVKPAISFGQSDLLSQLGTALAMRAFHKNGLHVCFTLNAAQVVRLTPALNMPEDIFDEIFERVEKTAKNNKSAWHMLPKTRADILAKLAKLAL